MAAAKMIAAPASAGGDRFVAAPGAASSLRRCSAAISSPSPSSSAAAAAALPKQQQQLLLRLAAEMQKQPADDSRTFAPSVRALYDSLLSVQSPDDVASLLDNLGVEFPLPVFSSVIRKLGTSCRTSAALSVYEWLHTQQQRHRRPDIFIYCSVLGVARRSARFDLLPLLLRRMSDDGVAPDLVAYKIIIACYEAMNLHLQAMAAFQEMASKGFPLHDASTVDILLRGCESAADIDGALGVYASATCPSDGAGSSGVSADKLKSAVSGIAYRCIRRMLSDRRCSSHSHILGLIERVESAIGRLSVADYQGIIWSCNGSRNGGGGGAAEDHLVAQRMVSRRTSMGYRISAAACNHAMHLLQRAGDPDAAMAIFEEMQAHGPPPDADSYRILRPSFKSRLRQPQADGRRSVRLLSEMAAHGVVPDGDMFDAAMAGCADGGDAEGAAEVLGRMVEGGRMPGAAAYGALLRALQGGGQKEMAGRVWEHMKKVGIKPNAAAYAAMGYVEEAAAGERLDDGSRAVVPESVSETVSDSVSAPSDSHTRIDASLLIR